MSREAKEKLSVYEANVRRAMAGYHARHPGGVVVDMPFDEIMDAGSDGLDGKLDEYDYGQRLAGIKGLFRYLVAEGNHPSKLLKRLFVAGRGFLVPEFCNLTNEEAGLMAGETKGAHSWRMGKLSEAIERTGMKGSQLSGQKSKASKQSYAKAQMGNTNRKKKKS